MQLIQFLNSDFILNKPFLLNWYFRYHTYVSDLLTDLFADFLLDQRFSSHEVEEEGHQGTRRFVPGKQEHESLPQDLLITQCRNDPKSPPAMIFQFNGVLFFRMVPCSLFASMSSFVFSSSFTASS